MPTRRHDHDAGGSAELLAAKAELRNEVWAALRAARATRFPGPEGRIPNFVGAEAAAERLRGTDPWQALLSVREAQSAAPGEAAGTLDALRRDTETRCLADASAGWKPGEERSARLHPSCGSA